VKKHATIHFACNDHRDGSFAGKVNLAAYAENDLETPGMAEVRFTGGDDFILALHCCLALSLKQCVIARKLASEICLRCLGSRIIMRARPIFSKSIALPACRLGGIFSDKTESSNMNTNRRINAAGLALV
jgi:hypothetical protein